MENKRESLLGRFYGIFNVEGDDGPLVMLPYRIDAERELARRLALAEDDDDRLTEYHQVLPVDVAGAIWNSYDPDPREDSPLNLDEIVAVHKGE